MVWNISLIAARLVSCVTVIMLWFDVVTEHHSQIMGWGDMGYFEIRSKKKNVELFCESDSPPGYFLLVQEVKYFQK